ncbi:tripartite tricarboxylate transporter TctB family protein [Psychromarinibacter sp. C21-152]|uniref:Tripartite tricarboxylate transporter TctB family protein n=1 Tax=Psychromarinibacter sediminicola TaxID=3033385 RepID=A0AAE3NPR1_9RHOB|nr:tripartite tricarboxylate transporter TctB family protein [Psychromarinibacter sediminicola]MDF0599414.1 tripartite tricarboxylate transporter TctB family protein [Psychromarinibacter sediminicola]
MRIHDSLIGALLVLFGGWVLFVALGFPDMPGQSIGPGTFPSVLGVAFLLGGLCLIVAGRSRGTRRLADLNPGWRRAPRLLAAGLATIGVLVLALSFETVGFPLSATVLLYALFFLEGYRGPQWLALCIAFVFGMHLLMTRFLLVPLPAGPLESFL